MDNSTPKNAVKSKRGSPLLVFGVLGSLLVARIALNGAMTPDQILDLINPTNWF